MQAMTNPNYHCSGIPLWRRQARKSIIYLNPYGHQQSPPVFAVHVSFVGWSWDKNSGSIQWRNRVTRICIELSGVGRGTIFETPHNHSAKIFLAQRIYVQGSMLHDITQSLNQSDTPFVWLAMLSCKCTCKNSSSARVTYIVATKIESSALTNGIIKIDM